MPTESRGRVVGSFISLLGAGLSALVWFNYRRDIHRARERVSAGSRIVETPCGPIEYGFAGDGPPVLVVHGAGGGFDQGLEIALPIGGTHLWHSRKALRPGGRVVGYGLRSSLRGEGLASGRPGRRQRFRGTGIFGLYIAGGWLLPGRKRVVPYSIQSLKRLKPELFRQDLIALFDLLQQKKLKPLIAQRFPLAEARQAQELLGKGGVTARSCSCSTGHRLSQERGNNGMQRTALRAAADAER